MRIFDCFMYFDEELLLDLRLNILYDYVDKFLILEAKEDHQGNKRELNFNINNYKKFQNKIKYIALEKIEIDPKIKLKKNWHIGHLRDQSMRNSISKYLSEAHEEDWIIISDLDEIPNPDKINHFNPEYKFAFFEQKFFYYKFNILNSTQPNWYGSRICVKKYLKSPQWLRNIKVKKKVNFIKKFFFNIKYMIIQNGGWHFSNLKLPKDIIIKLNSFCHGEFNKEEFKNEKLISEKINNLQDIFNRNISYKKVEMDNSYPKYLIDNIESYKNWII